MASILPPTRTEPKTLNGVMTPAWIVYAWPPVLWQADSAPDLRFVHLGTCVLNSGDRSNPCVGQTLWGQAGIDPSAGVAWDWVEVHEGVVAMSDPLGVVTNLRLLDAGGEVMSQARVALHLSQLVHGLPWQTEVCRALQQPN